MNKEKDFFETCFNTVAGLEVKNESQAIAKEVVLSEVENLQQQVKKQKEVIDKLNNYIDNYDVFKIFSFPLMKKWEENQIKSSIDYEFKTSLIKDLKDILKEV